jgi:hypothetical protein
MSFRTNDPIADWDRYSEYVDSLTAGAKCGDCVHCHIYNDTIGFCAEAMDFVDPSEDIDECSDFED